MTSPKLYGGILIGTVTSENVYCVEGHGNVVVKVIN